MIHINNLSLRSQFQLQEIEESLLPRRREILNTIRANSPCSADYLYRNFVTTPESTIRYDLLALQKKGLINKLGTTRGALYSI